MPAFDQRAWEIQVRKGLIEYMTLQLLSLADGHGYEIVQRMRILAGFDVTESAIYPILSKFREEGFLTVYPVPSSSGPNRNMYQITALGKTRLLAMSRFITQIAETLLKATSTRPS